MILLLICITWGIGNAADIDDNSILEELEKENTQELDVDFSLKTFESCDVFEDVMQEYFELYWENNYRSGWWYGWPIPMVMEMQEMDFAESESLADDGVSAKVSNSVGWGTDESFSETNTQVKGVDEADIVKTDGKYLYYYNETQKAVYIMSTSKSWLFSSSDLEVIKKINLPKTFYSPELYISDERLVVVASGYSQVDYSSRGYYINRNAKTYTIVFDTSDIEKPELIKLYSSDGNYNKSRRIWDYVYVLSTNYFDYPYWNIKDVSDIEIDAEAFLPKAINISRTDDENKQNLTIKNTDLPYEVTAGNMVECNAISYNLPDEETLKNTNFNPGYNIISIINIEESEQEVETQVIAGSNNEIYMSTENLYMTEGIWQPEPFYCPEDALCARPFFWGGTQNTLIHKLNFDKSEMSYQDSALVPGAPLTQYSMDEYDDHFRIITSEWSPERSTGLYILDEDLELTSSLTNLAPGETFQSSRFIGDKLFLVTFEQIDPLFAIDVSDEKNPEVLGELKIPGFSTYLHPYDENHLIGLGYDTQINQWGGTQTAGVKVDLYKINYDKKCGDSGLTAVQEEKCESGDYKGIIVEQLYTETLWGKWSYSEALNNPRMFVWNADKKILLLPATLYEKDDNWRTTDYYDGLFAIKIDKNSGINVNAQTTHINIDGVEEKRLAECENYSGSTGEPVCRELLSGEIHCEVEDEYRYVPEYCYKDSDVWQYIGDRSWEFRDMSIKRALYIWDEVYGFSDSHLGAYDWNLNEKESVDFE